MNIPAFAAIVDVERYQRGVGTHDFLNGCGAKGPYVILDGEIPVAVGTDVKTPGYKMTGFVDSLVLPGGNWQDATAERKPRDVYEKRMRKELPQIADLILNDVVPFRDYFSAVPEKIHGHSGLPGPYCDVTSIFVSRVQLRELYDVLHLSTNDRRITTTQFRRGKESAAAQFLTTQINRGEEYSRQRVTSVADFVQGDHPTFGFGDGAKTSDVLEHLFGFNTDIILREDVEVVRLLSHPDAMYATRREVLEAYLREDNNPFFRSTEEGHVFRKRR